MAEIWRWTARLAPVMLVVALLAWAGLARAGDEPSAPAKATSSAKHADGHAPKVHAAMDGKTSPVAAGEHDLDELLYPPKALPYKPGRVREYNLVAQNTELEIVKGVTYKGWTYNGTAPGPVIRATEGDILRVNFKNETEHPHTIHFHGEHPSGMDGVEQMVEPGDTFTYEFVAKPGAMQVYHCHAMPLKKHIAKGLYGNFIIDPRKPRKPARELSMVMNAFDVNGDTDNDFYAVNGKSFFHDKYPVQVKRDELVRIYLANLTEHDQVNSFHLHGNFFKYFPTGSTDHYEYTDMINLAQGERGIVEVRFPHTGRYMFHAHQTEFADLGWTGFFNVTD
jgi:FtsP/CotA-like multicopper oxidase with cupredoxin domain